MRCPTCGSDVNCKLLVDIISNTIAYDKFRWEVSHMAARFMSSLVRNWPGAVTEEDLMTEMWGVNNGKSRTNLSVYASHLRKMIHPFGIKIWCQNSAYRLVFPDSEEAFFLKARQHGNPHMLPKKYR